MRQNRSSYQRQQCERTHRKRHDMQAKCGAREPERPSMLRALKLMLDRQSVSITSHLAR
jgi:hypothetical protein